MAKSVELTSRDPDYPPPAPAAYINKDTIRVATGPGKMEHSVIPVVSTL